MTSKLFQISLGIDFDRDKVRDMLDKDPNVSTWFYAGLPYVLFIKTTLTPKQITQKIETLVPSTHLVVEISSSYWGRLDTNLWGNFPTPQI